MDTRINAHARRLLTVACGVAFALGRAPPALADADDSTGLQEIVVVGEKQESSLQKAPESITALTGATLEQSNIVTPLDLNGQVPGLVITTSEGYDRSVSIRGIGFNVPQDDSAQPSVSYHEDGIYIANPVALNSGFLDVDHVEVLRGPQGTVFGQNSIGGTVNVISKMPTFAGVTGFADLSSGSYDLVHASGAVNVPITDTFAIRAAFDQNYQHGYVTATQVPGTNGDYDLDNQNNFHARILALWQPQEDLSVLLRTEYAQAREHESEGKNILDPDTDPWRETSDWPGRLIYDQKLAALTVTYNLSFATLKSLTSWQSVDQGISVNEDGLDLALAGYSHPLESLGHDVQWFLHDSQTYTQELDLSSNPGGKLDWIIGAFYLKNRLRVGYDQYMAVPGNSATPDLLDVGQASDATVDAIYSGLLYFQNFGLERRDSYSGYGQATYHFTDSTRATAGLRYTYDHNTTEFGDYYNLFGPTDYFAQKATKLTYRAALEQDLTPANLLYASVSSGFKPGGGNISLFSAVVPFQFQPETIVAYELGSKNSFLDRKLTVNVAGFYYLDHNMQFQAEDLINYEGGVDNIPSTQVYGIEGEISALLPFNLRFDGNATLEKGRITSHFLALDNVGGNAANQAYINQYGIDAFEAIITEYASNPQLNALRRAAYKDVYGNAPPSLPDFTFAANLSHTLGFHDGSSLLSRVGVQYRSDYADTIFGKTPIYTAPGYTMVNLYFDYTFAQKAWDFSLAVNNVGDAAAVLSRFTNQFGGETTQQYFPPREFVAKIGYKF
jgi:iron complex outermembrane receptor protein